MKVCREVEKLGMVAVYVNFYGLLSVAEAADRIEEAYTSSLRGPIKNFVLGTIRAIGSATVKVPGFQLSVGGKEVEEGIATRLSGLLDLPAKIWAKHGKQTLVIFDEFQDVLETKPPLDGLLRSKIERHGSEVSYIFAGSHPGMMRTLFSDQARPFFGQARAIPLTPLPDDALAEFLGAAFARSDRDVGDVLALLLDTAEGHPQRAMMLAHHLWERTPKGTASDAEAWNAALEDVYLQVKEQFDALWKGLPAAERRALALIASGPDQLKKEAARKQLDLPRTTARRARDKLLEDGHVEERGSGYYVVDPLLAMWVRAGRQGLLPATTTGD